MAVVTKMVDRTRWRTRRVVVRGRTHSHTPRRAGRERGGNTGENMDSHNKALHIISSMSTSYHCLCPGNPSLAFRTQRYLGFLFSLDNNRTGSLPSKAVVKKWKHQIQSMSIWLPKDSFISWASVRQSWVEHEIHTEHVNFLATSQKVAS